MKNDKIMIPEVTSVQLFKLINHIYPAEKVTIEKLNGIFGRSKVANASVTGESIGLLVREKSSISLTEQGQNLGRALASKNLEDKRNILKELVLKNRVLEFVYSLITEKKIMKNREIGQKISMQFNKNWKHELSYARYGTNCGDILAAAGLGDYVNGIYSLAKIESSGGGGGDETSAPYLGFEKILKILKALVAKEKNVDELENDIGTKKERLSSELKNCIDLNIVKKSGEMFSITALGRDLINPINKKEIQKNLFAEIMRKSPYAKIIEIVVQNPGVDRRKIGDVVDHELKKGGGDSTRYDMGKKFADWLNAAGISSIERSKKVRGKQKELKGKEGKKNEIKISKPKEDLTEHSKKVFQEVKSEKTLPPNNQNTIFQIGRLIERIEIKNSVKQDIANDMAELIALCEKEVSLKSFVNMLSSHFQLYREINDFRIIEADLRFLKEKFGD